MYKQQLRLQTNRANTSNINKSSHTFTFVDIRDFFKTKKSKLKLKSIRAVIETDEDFLNEINGADTERFNTFNIFLVSRSLNFKSVITNEYLLSTHQITLPRRRVFNVRFHRNDLEAGRWFFETAFSQGLDLRTYVLNPSANRLDGNWRFMVINAPVGIIRTNYLNKPARFNNAITGSVFYLDGVVFDDGTNPNIGGQVNITIDIAILEWYSQTEPNDIDHSFITSDIIVEKHNDRNIDLSIEYRDIETNTVLTNTPLLNGIQQSYPDYTYIFDIESIND